MSYLAEHGSASAGRGGSAPGWGISLEQRLDIMDQHGVAMQVLSVGATTPYLENEVNGAYAARLANDLFLEIGAQRTGRFGIFGTLPLPHVDAALAETERCLGELHMLGVTLGCSIAGRPLDEPEFSPLFEELDHRGAVLFIHPQGVGATGPLVQGPGLRPLVGLPFEDTVSSVRLALSGWIDRYPNIRVIVPHLGGMLPYLFGRFDYTLEALEGQPAGDWRLERQVIQGLRRFWFYTVRNHPPALRCACETLGADRLVFGSDFPFLVGDQFTRCVNYIGESGLAEEDARAILDGNAAALLGLAE